MTSNASETTHPNNFLERIEDKVRYIVFDAPDGFRDSFVAQGDSSIFDHDYQPEGYDYADLIVFFFNDWSEVRQIPGADKLGLMVGKVEKLGNVLADTYIVTANGPKGPRPVMFSFYNLKNLKGCGPELIAESIINDVVLNYKEGDRSVFGKCNNQ